MDKLLGGRMCFASVALGLAKVGISVAVRFSQARLGFGPSPDRPFPVLSYGTQMRGLIPRLAVVVAMQAGMGAWLCGCVCVCGCVAVCGCVCDRVCTCGCVARVHMIVSAELDSRWCCVRVRDG